MAHDTSPSIGEVYQAAVLVPPALPSERHESVGPLTNTWPSRLVPVGLPTISTKASRAACAGASGHGWFDRHVPSLSRAAMPARRMRGPSAHQTGPSPSQTRVGVHKNVWPAGTTGTSAQPRNMLFQNGRAACRERGGQ